VRYRHDGATAEVTRIADDGSKRERHGGEPTGPKALVTFDEPVRATTKGQVAVLYDEHERVLGGGRIARSFSEGALALGAS
jgi:tRNA U34 2-thiouridine synthase MnmA/TrmU